MVGAPEGGGPVLPVSTASAAASRRTAVACGRVGRWPPTEGRMELRSYTRGFAPMPRNQYIHKYTGIQDPHIVGEGMVSGSVELRPKGRSGTSTHRRSRVPVGGSSRLPVVEGSRWWPCWSTHVIGEVGVGAVGAKAWPCVLRDGCATAHPERNPFWSCGRDHRCGPLGPHT